MRFNLGDYCKVTMTVFTDPPLKRGDLVRVNLVRRRKNYWEYGVVGASRQIAYVREDVLEKA